MKELILDGVTLDLEDFRNGKGELPLSKEIGSITEPGKSKFDRTLSILLPHSPVNDNFFGFSHRPESASNKPYQRFEARYNVNGIPIIQKGSARLVDSSEEGFKVQVTSGNADFWRSIEGKSITELDFETESLGKKWDRSTMYAARNTSTGLVCPFIDWGALAEIGVSNRFDVRASFFCVYLKNVVEKIISEAGFTQIGDVFSEDNYTNAVITLDNVLGEEQYSKLSVEAEQDHDPGQCYYPDYASGGGAFIFPAEASDPYDLLVSNSVAANVIQADFPALTSPSNRDFTTRYEVLYSGEYTFTYTITYNNLSAWSGTKPFQTMVNGVVQDTLNVSQALYPASPNTVNRTVVLNLAKGDYVEFWSTSAGGTDLYVLESILEVSFVKNNETEGKLSFGDPVSIAGMLPDMDQVELMATFTSMYGLFLKVDPFNKQLKFFRLDDIKANKANAIDWSDKLQASTENVRTVYQQLSQENWMRWIYDDVQHYPTKREGFADDFIGVSDENLSKKSDFFNLPFAASEDVTRYNQRVAGIKRFTWDAGTIEEEESQPRILLVDTRTFNLDFFDGGGTSPSASCKVARFSQVGFSENLDFTTLKQNFLSTIQSVLQRPKIVTAQFWLTESDINQFDFEKPVYINHFGAYFYVNRIENYIPNQPTTVELIRLV